MTALPPWTLPQFEQYVEIALETMAKEGVVRADAGGKPLWERRGIRQGDDGSLSFELSADLSAIGLPSAVRMAATTQPGGNVAWSLGGKPVVTIPGEWTPEEAGEGITGNRLTAAYRQQPGRSGGRGR